MALDSPQIFISAQYLENKLTDFHQLVYIAFILTRSTLGLLHIIFRILVPRYGPLSTPEFCSPQYLENKLTEFHQILYVAFILTRSTLGLLHIFFRKLVPEI